MRTLKLLDRGDTILEVLIAIAVISTVLAGAYVSSSRSANASRQAQERGEALKLVGEQLERLKARAGNASDPVYGPAGTKFCISSANVVVDPIDPAYCNITPVGGVTYELSIQRTSGNQFAVFADWDRIGGGREQARVIYRIYPQ